MRLFAKSVADLVMDLSGNETGEIAAERSNLLNGAGTEIEVFCAGGQKECVGGAQHLAVHERHLEFIFKVGHSAKTFDYNAVLVLLDIVDQKTVVNINADIGEIFCNGAQHFSTLFSGERGVFGRVDNNQHHNFGKKASCACNYIKVSECDRVKASRANGSSHLNYKSAESRNSRLTLSYVNRFPHGGTY